jgi:hypothetical protein
MISDIETFSRRLNDLDPEDDDFDFQSSGLVADLDPALGADVCPVIFQFFETHPTSYVGVPGPLVHLLESFHPGHVELLIDSVRRCPSVNSIWMLNRILNSNKISQQQRSEYFDILNSIAGDNQIHSDLSDRAGEFVEWQSSKS